MDLQHLFPTFDLPLIAELNRIGILVDFAEGEMLMRTGQYFKHTLIVLEGTVKLYREGENSKEFFLYYLEPGNACALSMICALKSETSQMKAKAITPVKALAIPLQFMDGLMKNYRNWYYFVLENYRNRFEELLQVADQVAFHSLDEKLEFYLKRQFTRSKEAILYITHQEIADDLNTSREVISRLLKKLESLQYIEVSRHTIKNLQL